MISRGPYQKIALYNNGSNFLCLLLPGAVPLSGMNFGQGLGETIEYIACTGTEKRLIDCTFRHVPNSQCTHGGVRCGKFQHNIGKIIRYLCKFLD